ISIAVNTTHHPARQVGALVPRRQGVCTLRPTDGGGEEPGAQTTHTPVLLALSPSRSEGPAPRPRSRHTPKWRLVSPSVKVDFAGFPAVAGHRPPRRAGDSSLMSSLPSAQSCGAFRWLVLCPML